jgi:hypothetical protein
LRLGEILLQIRLQNRLLSPLRTQSFVSFSTSMLLTSPLSLPPSEEEQLKNLGAIRTEQGKWVLPDGRKMISKALKKELLTYLHKESHWEPQAMCDEFCEPLDVYTSQTNIRGCLTC